MSDFENQILINQITIMEALIAIFHQSNNWCVCRNLELRCDDSYGLLKKEREKEVQNE